MKSLKLILISLIVFSGTNAFSNQQDTLTALVSAKDTAWTKGAFLTFTFGQTYFSDNWAGGGEPSYSLSARANLFANYELGKVLWQNKLDLAYGFTEQKTSGFRKNDDLIELTSNYGYRATKKWYYSAVFSAKTQFDEGIKYTKTDTTSISNFLSPLSFNLALGMNYKHDKYFQVFLSPLNVRLTYVDDTAYSVINSIDKGEHWRQELGFIAKLNYTREFSESFAILSKLDIFYDYLETSKLPTVTWEVLATLKVYKMLSVNVNTLLIYDENVRETDPDDPNETIPVGWQFKEIFGAGITFTF